MSHLSDASPVIVWPAPGAPAFVSEPAREVEVIVRHRRGMPREDLRRWASSLRLQDAAGESWATSAAIVEQLDLRPSDPRARALADQREQPDCSWARLRLGWSTPVPVMAPRSVRVLSIISAERVERRNAVAIFTADRRLRLAFASDLHIASLWDRVAEIIDRHAPDLAPVALHPSRLLARFVVAMNHLAARGEVDLVVLGGDLVDHIYSLPRGDVERGHRDTNIDQLLDLLAPLQVPFVAIPGNHDYRLFPWRPRVYGLGAIGLGALEHERLLRAAGWWGRWPMVPSDLDALRTEADGHEPPLSHHFERIAPSADFHVDVRGMRLIFVDSGRDLILNWHRVEPHRRGLLLRALRHTWVDPDSEGLSAEQLDRVDGAVRGAQAIALFVHAPLFHPRPSRAPSRLDLDPGDGDRLEDQVAFEKRLFATGQRGGVLFRNPGGLLRSLRGARGPVTVFSGHVHKATCVNVDRRGLHGQVASFAPPSDPSITMPILTTPSLGHYRRVHGEAPGYVLAAFDEGALVGLERKDIL